jgi:hypothetical protein
MSDKLSDFVRQHIRVRQIFGTLLNQNGEALSLLAAADQAARFFKPIKKIDNDIEKKALETYFTIFSLWRSNSLYRKFE